MFEERNIESLSERECLQAILEEVRNSNRFLQDLKMLVQDLIRNLKGNKYEQ